MRLWVVWDLPHKNIPVDEKVLSFLKPADEKALTGRGIGRLLLGRELSLHVRGSAITLYRDLVARIGTAALSNGTTLRRSMQCEDRASLWWYHPVAFRDPESDPTFNNIIQALTIVATAAQSGAEAVVLCGAPEGMAEVLRSRFAVKTLQRRRPKSMPGILVRGIASRCLFLVRFLRHRIALSRYYTPPLTTYDVVLSSFWDWGYCRETSTGGYADRYFKRLPTLLSDAGVRVGYFAWFSPDMRPLEGGRDLGQVLKPLRDSRNTVILQALLSPVEVIHALGDFSVFLKIMRALRDRSFREVFRIDHLDWFPLFRGRLISGAVRSTVPQCQLVAAATERAAKAFSPKVALSFLEHYPYSRAHYEGLRRSGAGVSTIAVQHASYTKEKMIGYLHPQFEFNGLPDGCTVPHPERVFVMGELGREVFLEQGYSPSEVVMSGSPRYDHVVYRPGCSSENGLIRNPRREVNVLIACSLDIDTEIELVEAIALAARPLKQVSLRMRNHPASRVDKHPRFVAFRELITVSDSSLEDDIAWAEVIIFTYSTVADEAYVEGKRVWQWLPMGFNGSGIATLGQVPQFTTVSALRIALLELADGTDRWPLPSEPARAEAARKLFHPADGHAADRIAVACIGLLNAQSAQA